MKELASQHFKVNDSRQQQPQNLLNSSSSIELEPIHARIKASDKEVIQELAETNKFHSQASVIRELVRRGLKSLLKEVRQ